MAQLLNTDQAHWVSMDMSDGQEFEIAGARGCFESIELANDFLLHRCELNIYDDCVLCFEREPSEPCLGTAILLLGESTLNTPCQRQFSLTSTNALLLRIDQPGSQFHLKAGQIVRHLGVSCSFNSLAAFYPDGLPPSLDAFTQAQAPVTCIKNIPASHSLRALASSAFSSQLEGEQRLLKLQAIAASFFAETLDAYNGQQHLSKDVADWEQMLVVDVIKKIKFNLQQPLTTPKLAKEVGLTEGRLDALFKAQVNKSCAVFIRSERLERAKRLLSQGHHSVKAVALAVGYQYMGNFSRAYQKYFGESPARTRRRA